MSSDTIEKLMEDVDYMLPTVPNTAEPGISAPLKELRQTARTLIQILMSQISAFMDMEKSYNNLLNLKIIIGEPLLNAKLLKIKLKRAPIDEFLVDEAKLTEYIALSERFREIIQKMLIPLHYAKKHSKLRNITGFRGMRTHVTPSYNPSNYPTSENGIYSRQNLEI